NLGVVLFRSTVEESGGDEKAIVPSRVVRYIKSLLISKRYNSKKWQELFMHTLDTITEGNSHKIIQSLEKLQIELVTHININTAMESFLLKFMFGGRELTWEELEEFESRLMEQENNRSTFADYWNDLGIIHMIQCRNLYLQALSEFGTASTINSKYEEAKNNLELIKNNKKGFLILLRAILK
ncbi:MAG: hypothetical protein JSW07_09470, partial [bacterium]